MFRILILTAVVIVAVVPAAPAFADRDDDDGLRAVPFVFVGAPGDCGPLPGSNIVTSAWLPGMGLPDNGDPNTAANAGDRRFGLLLNKNGLTTDCSVKRTAAHCFWMKSTTSASRCRPRSLGRLIIGITVR